MNFDHHGVSVTGQWRDENEDAVLLVPSEGVFAVVDGMGGRDCGEVAARIAVDTFRRRLVGRPDRATLGAAWVEANEAMRAEGRRRGLARPMGAAATLVWTDLADPEGGFLVAHVGDTRAFKFDDRGIGIQLTQDDAMADLDALPEADAMASGARHIITQALGTSERSASDADEWLRLGTGRLLPGETLVLVSDGFGDYVDRGRLVTLVGRVAEGAGPLAERLCAEATERQADAGKGDNISVVVVRRLPDTEVAEAEETPPPRPGPRGSWGAAVALLASALLAAGWIVRTTEEPPAAAAVLPTRTRPVDPPADGLLLRPEAGGLPALLRSAAPLPVLVEVPDQSAALLEGLCWQAPLASLEVHVGAGAALTVHRAHLDFADIVFTLDPGASLVLDGVALTTRGAVPPLPAPGETDAGVALWHVRVLSEARALWPGWTARTRTPPGWAAQDVRVLAPGEPLEDGAWTGLCTAGGV